MPPVLAHQIMLKSGRASFDAEPHRTEHQKLAEKPSLAGQQLR